MADVMEQKEVGEPTKGTFSIRIAQKDEDGNPVKDEHGKTQYIYEDEKAEYTWNKLTGFAQIFEAEGAPLSDDKVKFLGDIFAGEEIGAVLVTILDMYNKKAQDRAKGNEYQRLLNKYEPASEEDKRKAFDRGIANLCKALGKTEAEVRAMLG